VTGCQIVGLLVGLCLVALERESILDGFGAYSAIGNRTGAKAGFDDETDLLVELDRLQRRPWVVGRCCAVDRLSQLAARLDEPDYIGTPSVSVLAIPSPK